MRGGNNSAVAKNRRDREDWETRIRARCAAAKLPRRADRYIAEGKSPAEVGALLLDELARRHGPEIETSVYRIDGEEFDMRTVRFYRAIEAIKEESLLIGRAYAVISNPKTRKQLLRILERGATTGDERLLLLEAQGLYGLVYRDVPAAGKKPRDIIDYIKSRKWVRKFKGSKGGRTRQVPAEWLAVQLAYQFGCYTGLPCWDRVAEIVDETFPVFQIPTNVSKSAHNVEYRRRRWIKEMSKRYVRWSEQFRKARPE